VRVAGISTARLLAAGKATAAVVLADGRVLAWGKNDHAQVGNGTTANQASPAEVPAVSAVWAVAAGSRHIVAADRATRVWGWGDNGEGELGTGSVVAAAAIAPERSDLAGALALAAHDEHTVAAMPDGAVKAFGTNGGRLGNGGTTASASPVTASGLSLATNTWLTGDADGDSLVTWREYLLGLDPLNPDTNGNGIPDGAELASGLDGLDPDADDDAVPNWVEAAHGTDPFNADTDGDSYDDGEDDFPLDAGRHDAPGPNPSDTTPPVITLKEPVSATPIPPPDEA
jgi:hypothetical protein